MTGRILPSVSSIGAILGMMTVVSGVEMAARPSLRRADRFGVDDVLDEFDELDELRRSANGAREAESDWSKSGREAEARRNGGGRLENTGSIDADENAAAAAEDGDEDEEDEEDRAS